MVRRLPRAAGAAVMPWLPAIAVILLLVARRALLMDRYPSGLDGGQWLAIGRGILGGEGRPTAGGYAPLVPVLTAGVALAAGAVEAVRFVAVASYALVLIAVAVAAVPAIGPSLGALVTLAVGSAGAINEPLAFGGYPQQVALAGSILAGWAAARLCEAVDRRNTVLAAIGLGLTALSHHVYFPLAMTVVVLVWFFSALAGAPGIRPAAGRLVPLAATAVLVSLPTYLGFTRGGYAPPLEATSFSLQRAWLYGMREAPLLWLLLVVAAVPLVLLCRSRENRPIAALAAALTIVGGGTFALWQQPRLLPPLLVGSLLAGGMAVARLDQNGRPRWVAATAVLAVAGWLGVAGDRLAAEYVAFYRVLDASLVEAAGSVERLGLPVAVRADRRNWPLGWWVQGLTDTRAIVGSDPRWLGFPEERSQAAAVEALFDGAASPPTIRRRAESLGVELLLLRKWEWIGWERWLAAGDPAVETAFDDDVTLLLRIRPSGQAGGGPGV